MSDESSSEQIDSHIKPWWDKVPNYKVREKWKPMVSMVVKQQGLKPSQVKFNLPWVKQVIAYAGPFDKDWIAFPVDSFNPESYPAHKAMYDFIKDELENLVKEEQAKAEAKRAKKKQEQLDKDADDRAIAEQLQDSIAGRKPVRQTQLSAKASVDAASNISSNKKKEKVAKAASPRQAEKVQAKIGGVADGVIQLIPSKTKLENLWDEYKSSREKYKGTKKAYLDELKVSKFVRLTESDNED